MNIYELLNEDADFYDCEECYVDEYGNELSKDEYENLSESGTASLRGKNPKPGSLLTGTQSGGKRKVVRQFKRYGNTFKRHFRCMTGPRKGRLVSSPEKCGRRKDPRRVRIGKKSSRMKKGQRTRRTSLAKRRSPSKILVRMNKRLRGEL